MEINVFNFFFFRIHMWPTFCSVTWGLISGSRWPREHAFQISDSRECNCLRALVAALWNLLQRLHGGCAPVDCSPTALEHKGDSKAAPCLGNAVLLLEADLSLRIFESPSKLSLDPYCSLPRFPQPPSLPRSPSLRVRLNHSLTALPPSLSSLPGIFPNTFLACLITF